MDVKDGGNPTQKTYEEAAEANAKKTINFFNLAGIVIVIAGIIVGLYTSWAVMLTNVSFGIIIIGIGEILRYLHKLSNKA